MTYSVSLIRFREKKKSVAEALERAGGESFFKGKDAVFIKPNIVFWTDKVRFPKWGVITTSRVVEDTVMWLKDMGVKDIFIGEGSVQYNPKDKEFQYRSFRGLGYDRLEKKYGVRLVSVLEGPFKPIEVDEGITLRYNEIAMECDAIMDLPVLKTHAQTIVSLGIKNLKGLIDMVSRKKCHSPDLKRDLNYIIARLADNIPPVFVLIDGIYSLERGPSFDGKPHRTDLLLASSDVISADKVGTYLLGYEPGDIPHIRYACENHNRPLDLSDVEIIGEDIDLHRKNYEYDFEYTEDGTMPLPFKKMGIEGISYPKYDLTLCTYCSGLNGAILSAIAMAWKGKKWDDIEVLTGKIKEPTGKKITILIGQCMYKKHKDNPKIKNPIFVKGCPPSPGEINKALRKAGIEVDPSILENFEALPGFLMKRYEGKKEFDESFYVVDS